MQSVQSVGCNGCAEWRQPVHRLVDGRPCFDEEAVHGGVCVNYEVHRWDDVSQACARRRCAGFEEHGDGPRHVAGVLQDGLEGRACCLCVAVWVRAGGEEHAYGGEIESGAGDPEGKADVDGGCCSEEGLYGAVLRLQNGGDEWCDGRVHDVIDCGAVLAVAGERVGVGSANADEERYRFLEAGGCSSVECAVCVAWRVGHGAIKMRQIKALHGGCE